MSTNNNELRNQQDQSSSPLDKLMDLLIEGIPHFVIYDDRKENGTAHKFVNYKLVLDKVDHEREDHINLIAEQFKFIFERDLKFVLSTHAKNGKPNRRCFTDKDVYEELTKTDDIKLYFDKTKTYPFKICGKITDGQRINLEKLIYSKWIARFFNNPVNAQIIHLDGNKLNCCKDNIEIYTTEKPDYLIDEEKRQST